MLRCSYLLKVGHLRCLRFQYPLSAKRTLRFMSIDAFSRLLIVVGANVLNANRCVTALTLLHKNCLSNEESSYKSAFDEPSKQEDLELQAAVESVINDLLRKVHMTRGEYAEESWWKKIWYSMDAQSLESTDRDQ